MLEKTVTPADDILRAQPDFLGNHTVTDTVALIKTILARRTRPCENVRDRESDVSSSRTWADNTIGFRGRPRPMVLSFPNGCKTRLERTLVRYALRGQNRPYVRETNMAKHGLLDSAYFGRQAKQGIGGSP